jgi:hypothetical protein
LNVGNRYYWLNFGSIAKHGTIEYRIHHGCTIPTRVAEWAKLCVKFTTAGLKVGRARSKPSLVLFDAIGLSEYEKRYWRTVSLNLHPELAPAPAQANPDGGAA